MSNTIAEREISDLVTATGLTREKVVMFLPAARQLRLQTPGMTLRQALVETAMDRPAGGRQADAGYFTK